jgi:hypothetical protein
MTRMLVLLLYGGRGILASEIFDCRSTLRVLILYSTHREPHHGIVQLYVAHRRQSTISARKSRGQC